MGDEDLVKLLNSSTKKDREASFTEVYNRYSPLVYNFCVKMIGNRRDSRDIFQDVFFKFLDSVRKDEHISNLKAYLLTISRNTCINYFKKPKEVFLEDFANYPIYNSESSYEDNELANILKHGISSLKDTYREIAILRYYEGMTYEEIAEVTGESYSNVKNKVWRSKLKIMKILAPFLKEFKQEININN